MSDLSTYSGSFLHSVSLSRKSKDHQWTDTVQIHHDIAHMNPAELRWYSARLVERTFKNFDFLAFMELGFEAVVGSVLVVEWKSIVHVWIAL